MSWLRLTQKTMSKASSQVKDSWRLTEGSRIKEVTVLSQDRLPGEGYRAAGQGGQVLWEGSCWERL